MDRTSSASAALCACWLMADVILPAFAASEPRPPSRPVPAPRNPVYAPERWSKDPYVLKRGKDYFLYTTDIRKLHSARSKDLVRWTEDREVAIKGETLPFLWAPSVLEHRGTFYLYYSAGEEAPGGGIAWPTFRVRVARSSDPRGPFRLVGDLILPPRPFGGHSDAGAIDPEVVRDDDGTLYCFYVIVLNGIPGKRSYWEGIRVQRLLSPTQADPHGGDTRVIDPEGNQTWQQNIVEAPTIVRIAKGKWALLYSGGASSKGQAVGVAYSSRLMGPGGGGDASWRKQTSAAHPEGEPVFRGDPNEAWNRASIGSTAVSPDPSSGLRLVYQGLDIPEGEGAGRWTIGVTGLAVSDGRLRPGKP